MINFTSDPTPALTRPEWSGVRPEWWGSGEDVDMGLHLQYAHDSLSTTVGGYILFETPGTHKIKSEVAITSPNVSIILGPQTVLDMTEMTGTGTANVHNTVNVLSVFNVEGANCSIYGGRFTADGSTVNGGMQAVGVLLRNGANFFSCIGSEFDTLYNSVWAGGGITDLLLERLYIDGLSHNLYMGYNTAIVDGAAQVTRAIIRDIRSYNSTNDGLKAASVIRNLTIEGGIFEGNTRDGIDLYAGGENVNVIGVQCLGNTQHGLDIKSGSLSGTGEGEAGNNRRVTVLGGQFNSNTQMGISALMDNTDATNVLEEISLIGVECRSNGDRGISLSGDRCEIRGGRVVDNGDRGVSIESCRDTTIDGVLIALNCTTEGDIGMNFAIRAGGYHLCDRVTVSNCKIIGSGVGTGQIIGIDIGTADAQNCIFVNNVLSNHNTNNWVVDTGMTGMRFRDNPQYVTENSGFTGAIATGATVAHGLAGTPTMVQITTTSGTPTDINVSAIGATTFTINYGGGGTNGFYWEARTAYAP